MKTFKTLLVIIVFICSTSVINAQVGIGTITPEGALDITSTTDGLLIPRVALTNTTTVTVTTPVASEIVYNTTPNAFVSPGFYYLLTAAGPWVRFGGTGWLTDGNAGTNATVNFIGTIDAVDLRFRRGNQFAGQINTTNTSFGLNTYQSNANSNNTAFGTNALGGSTNGNATNNTAVGFGALDNIGANNSASMTAVGVDALGTATTNSHSTAIGYRAAQGTTTGIDNTAVGSGALNNNTTGQHNTAVGRDALFASTGSFNTGIGYNAGRNNGGGTFNTLIGYQAAANGFTNSTAIGFGSNALASNTIVLGNNAITALRCNASLSTLSDRRMKSNIIDSPLGLDFIKTLRPVSYYKIMDEYKKTEYGFIAQEIETALNIFGDTNNGVVNVDSNGDYSLRYNDFLPITVKAVQEQQVLIEKLQKDNDDLKTVNAAILKRLEALENKK